MCFFKQKLPYPEEPPNYIQTVDNISIENTIQNWLIDYFVPKDFWNFWMNKIDIIVDPTISYPAGVWEEAGIRYMEIKPEYLNSGVIAHEQAHNSYALLSDGEKNKFREDYHIEKERNKLIKFLYSINTYGLTSDIEGHAEIYRYLGYKMPEVLKIYYPKLF